MLTRGRLGLVSLAGCQVQEDSHLKTVTETIQVTSLLAILSRPNVIIASTDVAEIVVSPSRPSRQKQDLTVSGLTSTHHRCELKCLKRILTI